MLVHWLAALLFVLAVGSIVSRGLLPSGHAWRPGLRNLHLAVGQLIFVLAFVRLAVRLKSPLPPAPGTPAWAVWAGHGAHALLYAVMVVQPLLGVMFMQAGDKTVSLFGLTLPALVGSDKELHFALKDAHLWVGNAFYGLLGLHVAAALWHHGVRRDDTLRRMLRLRATPGPAATVAPAAETDVVAAAFDPPHQWAARSIDAARASARAEAPAQAAARPKTPAN